MSISEKKSLLRKQLRDARLALSMGEQQTHALQWRDQLLSFEPFKHATHIGAYLAHKGEMDLQPLIDAAELQGKHLYLPVLNHDALNFRRFTPQTALVHNRYGLLEPAHADNFPTAALDIVLVPLVGFDRAGHRLGQGRGYYDVTFASRGHTHLIGVAHACQEVADIPTESHDVLLDTIITEREVICCLSP